MTQAILERLAAPTPSLRADNIESARTEASVNGSRLRLLSRGRELLAEPFLHFLLLGAALFGVDHYLEAKSRFTHITIAPQVVAGIAENFRLQYGSLPSPERLQALVDARVREEVFYHEALRLGLDKDDEIIRRRLVQKYEFLQQDLDIESEPNAAALQAFFAAHKQQYEVPATVSFSHVYFSTDSRGEHAPADAARAAAALAVSGLNRAVDSGDAFPGPTDFTRVSQVELGRVFGQQGLASEIFKLPPRQWSKPLASGLGWHLVYVNAREPARVPDFAEVRDTVRRDYLEAARAARNEQAYAKLKRGFVIERPQ